MKYTRKKLPHYRLEEPATGLAVAQTLAGYRLVPTPEADTFASRDAALFAAGAQPLDLVRVDA